MQVIRKSWVIVVACLVSEASGWLPLHAEPLIGPDLTQQINGANTREVSSAESPAELTELSNSDLLLDDTPAPTAPNTSTALPRGVSPLSRTLPAMAEADTGTSLHSVIKETVRPVYNELQESGALEVWRELKSDLGLGNNRWDQEAAPELEVVNPAGWQNAARPPKTAAQTQFDRDYDAYLLRQLIDDLTPWVLGLVGVYALGYLAKLIFNFMQWKTARRRERRLRHARHRASRRSQNSKQEN